MSMAGIAEYFPMIGIVGMIVLVIILLTYLASRVFKVPEWEAYLHIELSELMKSALILVLAILFFEGMNTVAEAWLGVEPGETISTASSRFLNEMMNEGVLRGMIDSFRLQTCLSIWNMFQRRIGEFVLTVAYKLFPGIDSFLSILNVVGFGFTAVYGSLAVQLLAMQFIDATMATFFLPAGIILRFFPPTREAGVFLIAFAIGFGVIFPATYVIHANVMRDLGISVYNAPSANILLLCGAKFPVAGLIGAQIINRIPSGLVQAGFALAAGEAGMNLLSPLEFMPILNAFAGLSLPGLFFPALSTTVTIAFINAMSKFLLAKM